MMMKQLMRGMTLLTVSETVTGGGGGKLGDSLQSNTAQSPTPAPPAPPLLKVAEFFCENSFVDNALEGKEGSNWVLGENPQCL